MSRASGIVITFFSVCFFLSHLLYLILTLQMNNKIKSMYNKYQKFNLDVNNPKVKVTGIILVQRKILSDFLKKNIKFNDISNKYLAILKNVLDITNNDDIQDLGKNEEDINKLYFLYILKNIDNQEFPIKSDWKEYKKTPKSTFKSKLIIHSICTGLFFIALIFSIKFLVKAINTSKRRRKLNNIRNR